MSHVELIRRLIGDGVLIERCLAPITDWTDYSRGNEFGGKTVQSWNLIDEKVGRSAYDEYAYALAQQIVLRIIQSCKADLEDDDLQLLASYITGDFHLVAGALEFGAEIPFVTAIWLSYRACAFPREPLEVDRPLQEVLNIHPTEAKRLLVEAKRQREEQLSRAQNEQTVFGNRVAATGRRLPDSDLLLEVLLREVHDALQGLGEPNTTLATTTEQLPSGPKIPDTWRELLRRQEQSEELPWDLIWSGVEKLLPTVFKFLSKHCCGVAVLNRTNFAPHLLYVYTYATEKYACGYSYGAYVSGPPIGSKVPQALKPAYKVLPARLQEFYSRVHDGWCQSELLEYGPLPLGRMQPLTAFLDPTIPTPIRVDTLWEVMRVLGGGRLLCLDVATRANKRPKAVFWYPSDEPETGLDFWKEYKGWLAKGLKSPWSEAILPKD